MKFVAGVLSGGKGERFWPLSREDNPKQFLKIFGNKSLIEETFHRLNRMKEVDEIFFISNSRFEEKLKSLFPDTFLILEPVGRNTAPACAAANEYALRKYGDCILAIFPSDHYLEGENEFTETIKKAKHLAEKGFIVTIGIKPDRPETGYGYIEKGIEIDAGAYSVRKFHEKPDRETAEKYLLSGNFYWNAGMFIWHVRTFDRALKAYMPDFYQDLKNTKIPEDIGLLYERAPEISVDYAIMEKADNIAVVEGTFLWEDLGSFPSLANILTSDSYGNIIKGEMAFDECENSILISEGPIIAALGLKDMIVVSTKDVVLVIPKSEAQKVKKLREILRAKNNTELL